MGLGAKIKTYNPMMNKTPVCSLGTEFVRAVTPIFMSACAETTRIVSRAIILRGLQLIPGKQHWKHVQRIVNDELKRQIRARCAVKVAKWRRFEATQPPLDFKKRLSIIVKAISEEHQGAKSRFILGKLDKYLAHRKQRLDEMFSVEWLWDACKDFNSIVSSSMAGDPLEDDNTMSPEPRLVAKWNVLVPSQGQPRSLSHHSDPKIVIDELLRTCMLASSSTRPDSGSADQTVATFLSTRCREIPRAKMAATRAAVRLHHAQAEIRSKILMRAYDISVNASLIAFQESSSDLLRFVASECQHQERQFALTVLDALIVFL